MTALDDATALVTKVCRDYRGTADDHDRIAAALATIAAHLNGVEADGDAS